MEDTLFQRLHHEPVSTVRNATPNSRYAGRTSGLAPSALQANLAILPEEIALDFMRFCQRYSKLCPLVGVSETNDPRMSTFGASIDIRSNRPAYNACRDGVLGTIPYVIVMLLMVVTLTAFPQIALYLPRAPQ